MARHLIWEKKIGLSSNKRRIGSIIGMSCAVRTSSFVDHSYHRVLTIIARLRLLPLKLPSLAYVPHNSHPHTLRIQLRTRQEEIVRELHIRSVRLVQLELKPAEDLRKHDVEL